jgi:vitamin B12/bleomycin/antimicrobial peptide transport system ATP-binding/permease protein
MKKYIFWLMILAAIEIAGALFLTYWRQWFWDAVAIKHGAEVLKQLGIFTGTALVMCFVSGFSGYIVSLTVIEWRKRLNTRAFLIKESRIENINQRIQDDCWSYPDLTLSITYGTTKAIFYIIVFSVSLMLSFSWIYLLLLIGYSVIGSYIAKKVAHPLIALNYEQQCVEATYRNQLYVENFTKCVHVMLGLAKKQKHLTYFQQLYGQIGVVLPIILIAPLYFSTGMTLGELMRFNSIGGTILDNMSYGITNFAAINKLLSCRKRLKEARII